MPSIGTQVLCHGRRLARASVASRKISQSDLRRHRNRATFLSQFITVKDITERFLSCSKKLSQVKQLINEIRNNEIKQFTINKFLNRQSIIDLILVKMKREEKIRSAKQSQFQSGITALRESLVASSVTLSPLSCFFVRPFICQLCEVERDRFRRGHARVLSMLIRKSIGKALMRHSTLAARAYRVLFIRAGFMLGMPYNLEEEGDN